MSLWIVDLSLSSVNSSQCDEVWSHSASSSSLGGGHRSVAVKVSKHLLLPTFTGFLSRSRVLLLPRRWKLSRKHRKTYCCRWSDFIFSLNSCLAKSQVEKLSVYGMNFLRPATLRLQIASSEEVVGLNCSKLRSHPHGISDLHALASAPLDRYMIHL